MLTSDGNSGPALVRAARTAWSHAKAGAAWAGRVAAWAGRVADALWALGPRVGPLVLLLALALLAAAYLLLLDARRGVREALKGPLAGLEAAAALAWAEFDANLRLAGTWVGALWTTSSLPEGPWSTVAAAAFRAQQRAYAALDDKFPALPGVLRLLGWHLRRSVARPLARAAWAAASRALGPGLTAALEAAFGSLLGRLLRYLTRRFARLAFWLFVRVVRFPIDLALRPFVWYATGLSREPAGRLLAALLRPLAPLCGLAEAWALRRFRERQVEFFVDLAAEEVAIKAEAKARAPFLANRRRLIAIRHRRLAERAQAIRGAFGTARAGVAGAAGLAVRGAAYGRLSLLPRARLVARRARRAFLAAPPRRRWAAAFAAAALVEWALGGLTLPPLPLWPWPDLGPAEEALWAIWAAFWG
jgi:hypothetical protein